MKLLFDQNLSPSLCQRLADRFPGSVHVRAVGLREASDRTIWDYAVKNGLTIITKDADFRQRSFLEGSPPKILWVGLGNCSTKAIETLVRRHALLIEEFLADREKSFLNLS